MREMTPASTAIATLRWKYQIMLTWSPLLFAPCGGVWRPDGVRGTLHDVADIGADEYTYIYSGEFSAEL